MAKVIEATMTISGWGSNRKAAVLDLIDTLKKIVIDGYEDGIPPEDIGVVFSECEETANYAGMYRECLGCQYRDHSRDTNIPLGEGFTCTWIPARDSNGCSVENNREKV